MFDQGRLKGKYHYTVDLFGLDWSVLQIKSKIVSRHTADSKPVKQEINSKVILPPLVLPGLILGTLCSLCYGTLQFIGLIHKLRRKCSDVNKAPEDRLPVFAACSLPRHPLPDVHA